VSRLQNPWGRGITQMIQVALTASMLYHTYVLKLFRAKHAGRMDSATSHEVMQKILRSIMILTRLAHAHPMQTIYHFYNNLIQRVVASVKKRYFYVIL
jgi:hypothetical protein